MGALSLCPITFATAKEFVLEHHRHHKPPQGWKFGVGVSLEEKLVGVAMVGRPVARGLDDGKTLEVTRCCTDGTPHVASMLYGACRRAAKALGYSRIVTYTLVEEEGVTLKAAGWTPGHITQGKGWNTPSRPRIDKHPTTPKQFWESVI